MAHVLEQADDLDPFELRRYVEQEFSPQRMVQDYIAAYEAAIAQARGPATDRPRRSTTRAGAPARARR